MRIIFFSEIKWDYLRTRKQQILTRFPQDWQILFIEPYKRGKKNKFVPTWQDNICVATMPLFFKNFKPTWLKWILSFKLVRVFVLLAGWLWIRLIVQCAGFRSPDLVMVSNIYAAPLVKIMADDRLPVIYDMNDNHLGFPDTPKWASKYFESLCMVATRIVMPCETMRELLPTRVNGVSAVVTNGVDYDLFAESRRVILYVGAVAEWVDTELLEVVAREFSEETLRLIGPVTTDIRKLGRHANVEFVGPLEQKILVDQIKQSSVCLVPFRDCEITAHTANINKVFEYLAAGKPVVSIGRPRADYETVYPGMIYSAESADGFVAGVRYMLAQGEKEEKKNIRKTFAKRNDWDVKAQEIIKIIKEIVN